MTEKDIEDLFLSIDLLIIKRLNNPNDTYEQFAERREQAAGHFITLLKIRGTLPRPNPVPKAVVINVGK